VPCPFGALLVTLYQIFSKGFLNGKRNIRGGGQPAGLAAAKTSLFRRFLIASGREVVAWCRRELYVEASQKKLHS
jgi:hypothetical protein